MSHFSVGQWVDLVRGLIAGADSALLQAHLASGCPECKGTLLFLTKLAETARADREYAAPEDAVLDAESVFSLQKPDSVHIGLNILGRLIYDSFAQPLPAGVRTSGAFARHALYQGADYSLDLRLERHHGSARVVLVGQIVNQNQRSESLADLPIVLTAEGEPLARTTSNALGEFQIEYEPRSGLRLYVLTDRSQ
jgi:hypothetical protein